MDNASRSATVKAIGDCVLVRIGDNAFETTPEIGMKIYRNMARVMSERLRDADEQLAWRL